MKRSCLSLFLLIALVALPSLAWAQSRSSVTWDSYNVEIAIQPNGDFIVTETQAISFNGTFSKAYREIPLDRTTGITDVQVGEPNRPYRQAYGVANSYSVSTTDAGTLRIDWWFPQTTNAQRTFIIRYRVHGGLRYYPGGDQLYWKAIYDNRAGPIRSARLSVTFPQDVPRDQLLATVYPGGLASGPDVPDPRTVQFSAQNVTAQTGLEVRVQFPHGLVQGSPPPWQATADAADHWNQDIRPILDFLALLVGLAIPVVGLVIVFLTWYTKGRDPRVSGVPEVLEQPPSDLPPGVAGTLVDEQADVQDVLATLLDLARRGIIQIQEEQNPELLGSSRDFVITQVQPNPIGLRAFERTVLAAVLPGGQPTRVSEMKGRFQAHIPLFRQQLFDEAVRAGLFNESPERSRQHYRAIALALLVLSLVGGIVSVILFGSRVDLIFVPFVGLGIVGLVLAWTSRAMARRTRAGALEAARWRAFGRYLAQSELRDGHQDVLERYLPYAVALGADREWLRKFASVGTPPPRWYGPMGGGYGSGGIPPIIILPGGGGWGGPGPRHRSGGEPNAPADGGIGFPTPQDVSDRAAGGLQSWSDALADLLNSASDALSRGGGSGDWSGGGGGGDGGGGGGGGGFG